MKVETPAPPGPMRDVELEILSWRIELELESGIGEWSWRVELELESGVGESSWSWRVELFILTFTSSLSFF